MTLLDDEVAKDPGRLTVWERFRRWLRGPVQPLEEEPPPETGHMVVRRRPHKGIVTPARGGVFLFYIMPTYTWTSDGLTRELRDAWVYHHSGHVRGLLTRRAANLARNLQPHETDELEARLNKLLSTGPVWQHHQDGASLACDIHVWVNMDKRVRTKLEPIWARRLEMQCSHEVELLRAAYADELSRHWMAILDKRRRSPLAAGAAALTDKEFAEVVREIAADEKALRSQLINVLQKAAESGGIGAYEIAQLIDRLNETLSTWNAAAPPDVAEDAATVVTP